MDSIVKRKNKYSVVYAYIDENGKKRQKWETFEMLTLANERLRLNLSRKRELL